MIATPTRRTTRKVVEETPKAPEAEIMGSPYSTVESILYSTIAKFWRRYGGCYPRMIEDVGGYFLHAYQTYRSDGGRSFSSWLAFCTWQSLRKQLRATRAGREALLWEEMDRLSSPDKSSFKLEEFVEALGADAQTAVRLAIQTPTEVLILIHERGLPTGTRTRAAIREHLISLGWGKNRINRAFGEIKTALEECEQ